MAEGRQHMLIMMTSSSGTILRVTGPLCGEFTGPGEFPAQRPVTRSFDVLFDLRLNKRLIKQWWGWWFEAPSWSLWRQCNDAVITMQWSQCPAVRYHFHAVQGMTLYCWVTSINVFIVTLEYHILIWNRVDDILSCNAGLHRLELLDLLWCESI